jgi:transposase
MRGSDTQQQMLFSYLSPEARVPQNHPLRPIREMADTALKDLSPIFRELYAAVGRPSIAPEKLFRSLLLQIFYSIRSERMLTEQLDYNLLFRWFIGLSMDESIWDHSVYTKNRDRILHTDMAVMFLRSICAQAEAAGLLSSDHFTVDGTLIESWASLKSFRPKDQAPPPPSAGGRNPEIDFHGEKRLNDTHASTSDPEARLFRKGKGKEARLSFMGHVLMENRHGFVVDTRLTQATGTAEREAAISMSMDIPGRKRVTLGADKGYDTSDFIDNLRNLHITPHVAQRAKGSAIDGRTTRHEGYAVSQRKRKRVEEIFGWMKTVGWLRKAKYRGQEKLDWLFTLSAAAYNMVRMRSLGIAASG